MVETRNAVIEKVGIGFERGCFLTAWVNLDYGGVHQAFGGYCLRNIEKPVEGENYAGVFISRVMQIAGVDSWEEMVGKTIRVKCEYDRIHSIGHIIKDDWFDPKDWKSR